MGEKERLGKPDSPIERQLYPNGPADGVHVGVGQHRQAFRLAHKWLPSGSDRFGTHRFDNSTMVNVAPIMAPIKCERGTHRHANNSTIVNVAPILVAEAAPAFQGTGANPEEFEGLTVWLKKHPAP